MAGVNKRVFESEALVSDEVCKFIVQVANDSITQRNSFSIGLSGKTPRFGCPSLGPLEKYGFSKSRAQVADHPPIPTYPLLAKIATPSTCPYPLGGLIALACHAALSSQRSGACLPPPPGFRPPLPGATGRLVESGKTFLLHMQSTVK